MAVWRKLGKIMKTTIAGSAKTTPHVMGGLTILRCFGLARIPYFAISATGDPRDDFNFASRYCRGGFVTADPAHHPEKALAALLAHGKKLPGPVPLYYSNDQELKLVSEHRDVLSKYFKFLMPAATTITDTLDKARFVDYCKHHHLPAPASYNQTEVDKMNRANFVWQFPLVVKPTTHINWFESKIIKDFGGLEYKAIIVHNSGEFARVVAAMQEEKIPFLVQRFIAGGDDLIYSFHTFLDENSEPLGSFVGKKIRTYPAVSGESTYLRLVKNDELRDLAIGLLKRIKFVGPVKLDFKQDAIDKKYYLLEINARYNLWHYLGASAGVNLPVNAYRYYTKNAMPAVVPDYRTDIRWLHFRQDVAAFFEYRRRGELSLGGWISSLLCKKVYDKFAWHDPLPAFIAAGGFIKNRVVRLAR